ncbi:TfuA-like protein [Primorskyibacter sp. S187A]|uniref:TfuA-like protein n=1 Tax=Primorskyibacter sp. S187A TaxID=3415130 RepID=UPI003C7B9857
MKPVVFLGPSLPVRQARMIFDAEYRPPAAQGDIMRAFQDGAPAIGLIDGVFKDQPTVRHREILWAMSEAVPVFGASSMGALRAAELSACGMIGVGLIYRWYRRFALLADDAVAVTHSPAEMGSAPVSDALVDIRRSVEHAVRQGALSREEAKTLLTEQTAKAFAQRHLPSDLEPYRIRQKARDAEALLRCLARHSEAGNWPKPETPAPAIVHAWLDDLETSGLSLDP